MSSRFEIFSSSWCSCASSCAESACKRFSGASTCFALMRASSGAKKRPVPHRAPSSNITKEEARLLGVIRPITTFTAITSSRKTFSVCAPTWSLEPSTLLQRICRGKRPKLSFKSSAKAQANSASLLLCDINISKSASGINWLAAGEFIRNDSIEKPSGKEPAQTRFASFDNAHFGKTRKRV